MKNIINSILNRLNVIGTALFDFSALPDSAAANEILEKACHDVKSSSIYHNKTTTLPADEILLSIILPTYNRGNLVNAAIDSVLEQKTQYRYELIVVNDGSQDNTEAVLSAYLHEPNVRIINQQNKGFSGARNSGIAVARGQYLMFIDDDDSLLPNAIESLMKTTLKENADIVEGGMVATYPDGRARKYPFQQIGLVEKPLGCLSGFVWGKVYKRELFDQVRFPDNYWFEDSINANLLYALSKRCWISDTYVYGYYQHDTNISKTSKHNSKSIDSLYITRQLLLDREALGLVNDQNQYEYFMHMVHLTYMRTRLLSPEIKKAIFVIQCELYRKYWSNFTSNKTNYLKKIEKAVQEQNYKAYVLHCELGV